MSFTKTIIDLGTGDGRFVYKMALNDPENLYIGIEPNQKQLSIYTKEANKKRLKNVRFIVGSLDQLPEDLINSASELYINFPWGRLLEAVVKGDSALNNVSMLLKQHGKLVVTFGFDTELEPSESARLGLSDISLTYIKDILSEKYKASGLELIDVHTLSRDDLKSLESSWSKKLAFGKYREIYRLILLKV